MKVANAEYISTIICRGAERKDTAKYVITVSNEHGEDSAEIDLVVLGQYATVQLFAALDYYFLVKTKKPKIHL